MGVGHARDPELSGQLTARIKDPRPDLRPRRARQDARKVRVMQVAVSATPCVAVPPPGPAAPRPAAPREVPRALRELNNAPACPEVPLV